MLVVEDDPAMAEIIATALTARGYAATIATTGRAATDHASSFDPDVILLDLGLPDVDGADVCRELRRWYRNPIIVVTADGDEARMIAALDAGADDYVTKPFSIPQLLARLRVAVRHRDVVASAFDPVTVQLGDLRVDTAAHAATIGDVPLQLARKEFELLAVLIRHPGRLVTHEVLLTRVWGTHDLAKTETLRTHVNQLRRKLGEGPERPLGLPGSGVGCRLAEAGAALDSRYHARHPPAILQERFPHTFLGSAVGGPCRPPEA